MKLRVVRVIVVFLPLVLSLTQLTVAQTTTQTASALPRLVRFGGTVKDLNGNALTGVVGITFAFYSEKTGGAPLWLETQNATADGTGHYTVLLGSTRPEGLPAELFTTEQARWVGVQVSGQAEQARVLLVSAPYALKAGDAETIGGLPPSAFVLAAPLAIGSSTSSSTTATVPPPAATDVTTTGGIVNYLPIFSGADTIIDSSVFQTGSGTTGKIGIDTTTPATQLDVNGAGTVRGTLSLPATGVATAAGGKNSQGLNIVASSFNSTSSTALNQLFRWQAEPVGNDTTAPSGTLNLLYGLGTAAPTETGLHVASSGKITFATGQTFPGTGDGSVTSVATGLGLKGGPITKTGTLTIDTTVVPQLAVANSFKAEQTITAGNTSEILNVTQNGAGLAIVGKGGISGSSAAAAGAGVSGAGSGTAGYGVYGSETATIGNGYGVYGVNNTQAGAGVEGYAANTSYGIGVLGDSAGSTGIGVEGTSAGSYGVFGVSTASSGASYGVYGSGASPSGAGVYGIGATGVVGVSTGAGPGGSFTGWTAPAGSGLNGMNGLSITGGNSDPKSATNGGDGLVAAGGTNGFASTNSGVGGAGISAVGGIGHVILLDGLEPLGGPGPGGSFTGGNSNGELCGGCGGDGIDAQPGINQGTTEADGYAGNFTGDVEISGLLNGSTPAVKIDDPLDPTNKYLLHAPVQSSEMMNLYTGNVVTDSQGQATVQLPEWFQVLNTDFRYQLTVIGQFAQAIVGHKIENNRFEIRTSAPNVEVSWQVTGVRQDVYAKAHPLVVEQEKGARLSGFFIHPELYGAPAEKQIEWARHPEMMKQIKEMQAKQLANAQKQAAQRN
jgi:hypothetical protein